MPDNLNAAIAKIKAVANDFCENQMYVWPGFDPCDPNPAKFFKKQRIEFDGELFIRYPVKRTFAPMPMAQIEDDEKYVGGALPTDYKTLLEAFGPLHLPGRASVRIQPPRSAYRFSRACWQSDDRPLAVLAISSYHATSDGNAIGFLRRGDLWEPSLYEFDHELVHGADSPALWTSKLADRLADFVLEYLDRA